MKLALLSHPGALTQSAPPVPRTLVEEAFRPAPDAHRNAILAGDAAVQKVIDNTPFEGLFDLMLAQRIPAEDSAPIDPLAMAEVFLHGQFTNLHGTGVSFKPGADNAALIKKTLERYAGLNMHQLATAFAAQSGTLTRVGNAFNYLHSMGLLHEGTLLPGKFLPELFIAAPVWYANSGPGSKNLIKHCTGMVGNDAFSALFQLYNNAQNRRPISEFHSDEDLPPTSVVDLLEEGLNVFDHLVIATPYLDVASKDWSSPRWKRNVDPYLFGLIDGFPYISMLARWSGSGVFPLMGDMIAGTVDHLRKNLNVIERFDPRGPNTWYQHQSQGYMEQSTYGPYVRAALKAFDDGNLFRHLRGEASETTTS